jgi:hypothetical protein
MEITFTVYTVSKKERVWLLPKNILSSNFVHCELICLLPWCQPVPQRMSDVAAMTLAVPVDNKPPGQKDSLHQWNHKTRPWTMSTQE